MTLYQQMRANTWHLLEQLVTLDKELVLLAVIIFSAVIVVDAVTMFARKQRQAIGLGAKSKPKSIDGSKELPTRTYVSDIQGLAGRPDAVIQEDGYSIPVERKPLSGKIRDRYIAQLLVYMRLVEEFEGKRPPYGYLILGAKCRKVRIDNTQERQRWLQGLIDEMRSILSGGECLATPHPRKCARCDVQQACTKKNDLLQIGKLRAGNAT